MIIKIRGAAAAPVAPKGFSARKIDSLKKVVGKISPAKVDVAEEGKTLVSLRLDNEIIAFFRSTGPGWQTRINLALRGLAGLENRVEKSGAGE